MNRLQTDFLLPRMTWLTGAGPLLNFGGRFYCYNVSPTEEEADARALFSDWSMVGEDLRRAMQNFDRKDVRQLELDFKPWMVDEKSEGQLDQEQIETLIREIDPKTFESIPIKERSKVTRLVRSIF